MDTDQESEEFEFRGNSIFDAIVSENVISLYSPTNVAETFFLCYVLEKCVAREDVSDITNHEVLKGSKYLQCKYYRKNSVTSGLVSYKLEDEEIYVLPRQVVCPYVSMNKKGQISVSEYQFLCDCI